MTFHLIPANVVLGPSKPYIPPSLEMEGFIHCTDGEDRVLETGNRRLLYDPRDFDVIEIDLQQVTAPWRYDDEEKIYPHIYGPLNVAAVTGRRKVIRDDDGLFLQIEPS